MKDSLVEDLRHDPNHGPFFGANAQAVHAGGAEPEVRVLEEIGASLYLAKDFARAVVPDVVDRANGCAFAALIASAQRLCSFDPRDLIELGGIIVPDHPLFEHAVPSTG